MISKETRKLVYDKYKGHCAYCGCEIEIKDMQVDHIVPKCRNNEMWYKGKIGTDEISNLNPSCRMCNYYKGMGSLEQFREKLSTMLITNVRRPFDYRLALKYGLVKEDIHSIKFYFEKKEEQELGMAAECSLDISCTYVIDGLHNGRVELCDVI